MFTKFDMWKLEMYCNWLRFLNKRARKKYCRKGYHKLISNFVSWKEGNKRKVTIHFLKCLHCNYYFFVTLKQKETYLKHEGTAKDSFSSFLRSLSGAKSKRLIARVGKSGEDVSASVNKVMETKK